MNGKDKKSKDALREIIKEAAEKEFADGDEGASGDEKMENSGQEQPPKDMLERIKKAIEEAQD